MINSLIKSLRQWVTDRRYKKLALKRGEVAPKKSLLPEKPGKRLKLLGIPRLFPDKKEGL